MPRGRRLLLALQALPQQGKGRVECRLCSSVVKPSGQSYSRAAVSNASVSECAINPHCQWKVSEKPGTARKINTLKGCPGCDGRKDLCGVPSLSLFGDQKVCVRSSPERRQCRLQGKAALSLHLSVPYLLPVLVLSLPSKETGTEGQSCVSAKLNGACPFYISVKRKRNCSP